METNETKNESTRALTRLELKSKTWAEWMPEIQNAGADTLEFNFDVEIRQTMWGWLEEEKEIAKMLMKGGLIAHRSMSRCAHTGCTPIGTCEAVGTFVRDDTRPDGAIYNAHILPAVFWSGGQGNDDDAAATAWQRASAVTPCVAEV